MTATDSFDMPVSDRRTSGPFPWAAVLTLTMGTLATVGAELLPAGLLLEIGAGVGVDAGAVGYLVTAWGLTIAALSLPLTRLTRRVDRRSLLVGAALGSGAATVLTGLAPTYALLVVFRILGAAAHGLFWSQVVVVGSRLATERAGEQHAPRAVALVVAGPTVASVAVIPALTALGEMTSWRWSFVAIGALSIGAGAVLRAVLPPLAPTASPAGVRRDPTVGLVVGVAVLSAVLLLAHFATFTFVAPILTGPAGLPRSALSAALLVFGAAGALGLAMAPALVRRLPRVALPATGAALAVSLVAVRVAHGSLAVIVAVALWGLVIGALPVVFQIRLLAVASEQFRATTGAVMVVTLNLGVAAGGATGAVLHDALGSGPLPLVAAPVAAAATAALWWVSGRRGSREVTR